MRKETIDSSFWSEMLPSLKRKAVNEALGSVFYGNMTLNKWLIRELQRDDGNGIFADTVFEPLFPWADEGVPFGALEIKKGKGLFHTETMDALEANRGSACPRNRKLFTHQMQACRILLDKTKVNSIIVASGTGSGKTECFMLPMLEDLVAEALSGKKRHGIRALMIYPLNALIDSQRERLMAWTAPLKGKVRFCLYNGDLPERVSSLEGQMHPEQVLSREEMRNNPPDILLSNPSMIERMLLRKKDEPLIEATIKARSFRWIIIDEAHNYTGSKAAELALLLRRMLITFQVKPEEVHFVATSATIDASDIAAQNRLKEFLRDLAGTTADRVHLILGKRQYPDTVSTANLSDQLTLDEVLKITDSEERKQALLSSKTAMAIRNSFITETDPQTGQIRHPEYQQISNLEKKFQLSREDLLGWIDALTSVPEDGNGSSLLMLRLHQYLNTSGPLMVCPDKNCPDRDAILRDAPDWHFGQIWRDGRQSCSCGAPLFPLAACANCNDVFLKADMLDDGFEEKLVNPADFAESSEFWNAFERSGSNDIGLNLIDRFEIDNTHDEAAEELTEVSEHIEETSTIVPDDVTGAGFETAALNFSKTDATDQEEFPVTEIPVLITNREPSTDISNVEVTISWTINGELKQCKVICRKSFDSLITCPNCDITTVPSHFYIRRISDKYARALIPLMLDYCGSKNDLNLPMCGASLISFTDSRKRTAELSAFIEREGERSLTAYITYSLLRKNTGADEEMQKKLFEKVKDAPELLAFLKKEFSPKSKLWITWNELQSELSAYIKNNDHLIQAFWMRNPKNENQNEEESVAHYLLLREFGNRPKNGFGLETAGLVSVVYPKLENVHKDQLPSGNLFTLDEWKTYLKHFLDYVVRGNSVLALPRNWRYYGGAIKIFTKYLLPPNSPSKAGNNYLPWPKLDAKRVRSGAPVQRFIRYTAALLDITLDSKISDSDIDTINYVLKKVYEVLVELKILVEPPKSGGKSCFYMECRKSIAVKLNTHAWRFSNDNRLYDTIIRSKEKAPCPLNPDHIGAEQVELPSAPEAEIKNIESLTSAQKHRAFREFLEKSQNFNRLLQTGSWNRLASETLEEVGYYGAEEHSAQISKDRRQKAVEWFKEGIFNVLSCSTTMEMGVDIGGVNSVLMMGVPPHPANYLQRAGRAGRRRETRANTVTICQNTARDSEIFADPRWALIAPQPRMSISIDSERIAARHVNAQILSVFMKNNFIVDEKITVETWLDKYNTPFIEWVRESLACGKEPSTGSKLKALTEGTILEQRSIKQLANMCADVVRTVTDKWEKQRKRLNELATEHRNANNPLAESAVRHQISALMDVEIYDAFVKTLILPASIRVTDVVVFDYQPQKEKNSFNFENQSLPSRETRLGLYEYAPGASVVIGGAVYKSEGLLLSNHVPDKRNGGMGKSDLLMNLCRCPSCGKTFLGAYDEEKFCRACGQKLTLQNIKRVIVPEGFTVSETSKPQSDLSDRLYFSRIPDCISMDTPWSPLGHGNTAFIRSSKEGRVISCNTGARNRREGTGFKLCLICGWSEPMPLESSETDGRAEKPHRPIRQISPECMSEGYCIGGTEKSPNSLQQGLFIANETQTDCLSIVFTDLSVFREKFGTNTPELAEHIKSAGISIAMTLRREIAKYFYIKEDEIGFTVDANTHGSKLEISLFDQENGGYCSSIDDVIIDLLRRARRTLSDCDCPDACGKCVLGFATNRYRNIRIDRHDALLVLSQEFMLSLSLPYEQVLRVGSKAGFIFEPMSEHISALMMGAEKATVVFIVTEPTPELGLAATDIVPIVRETAMRENAEVILAASGFNWSELPAKQQADLAPLKELGVIFKRTKTHTDLVSTVTFETGQTKCFALWETDPQASTTDLSWFLETETRRVITGSGKPVETLVAEPPRGKKQYAAPQLSAVVRNLNAKDLTLNNLGERLWNEAARALGAESMVRWIGSDEITKIVYTDGELFRYHTPAVVAAIINGLYQTKRVDDNAEILVQTSDQIHQSVQKPRALNHYFESGAEMRQMFDILKEYPIVDNPLKHLEVEYANRSEQRKEWVIDFASGRKMHLVLNKGVDMFDLLTRQRIDDLVWGKVLDVRRAAAYLARLVFEEQGNFGDVGTLVFSHQDDLFPVWIEEDDSQDQG